MKAKPKAITQYCIKNHFFDEVIKLPKEVKIESIYFEVGFAIKRQSQPIPAILRECGIAAIRKSEPSVEVDGTLKGSRAKMKRDINNVCDFLKLKRNTVRVKRMVVSVGKNVGIYHRVSKKLPEADGTKRQTVLGLIKWDGNEKAIADACNANTYKCKYTLQTVRTVLCEEG